MQIWAQHFNASFKDYSGYKVFRAEWEDPVSGSAMFDILTESNSVDIWAPDELENIFDTRAVDFMMSAEEAEKFQSRIFAPQFSSQILIDDAGELISQQKKSRGILKDVHPIKILYRKCYINNFIKKYKNYIRNIK